MLRGNAGTASGWVRVGDGGAAIAPCKLTAWKRITQLLPASVTSFGTL